VEPTRSDALRLASGLILLSLLPKALGAKTTWRLFGSWAILLQSRGLTRLPADTDIEVFDSRGAGSKIQETWAVSNDTFGLQADEAHRLNFSDPALSPTAHWQNVEVLHRARVISRETVNWVHRAPPANGTDRVPAGEDVEISLSESDVFALALREFPTLSHLPRAHVRIASREECVAQKWTRISKVRTSGRRHTRWQDLADVYDVVLGSRQSVQQPLLVAWIKQLANERGLGWPCLILPPPAEWLDSWDSYNYRSGTWRPSPEKCARELNAYLRDAVEPR